MNLVVRCKIKKPFVKSHWTRNNEFMDEDNDIFIPEKIEPVWLIILMLFFTWFDIPPTL